ncbi:Tol-Pal system beta propeller repeat protein TolB [Thauera sp.]|uniref:Tol-Pal system beta propeller repeat protein TolB n=1 Tax=Thauera sp. TaxID=1905334 RepID=UPI0039E322C4
MTRILTAFRLLLVIALAGLALGARAQLSIEITGAGASRFPVIIPIFEHEGQLPNSVTDVVRADLDRSGLFSLVDLGPLALPESTMPDLPAMRGRGADAVLTGSVITQGNGRYEVRFRLFDTQTQRELGAMALPMTAAQNRLVGHRIADFVYEKLTGEPGYFSTRIAYVVKSGPNFELQVADADGMNAAAALRSREPIISPAWSPDGQRLAYVSFEQKKPIVYVHTLATGQRRVVSNFKGSNSAPTWSPDGSQLAVVLTKDGQSQLYVLNADGSGVRRLASSSGIDTEPFWGKDDNIYFTSDRGGSPQIYRISAGGGSAQRVTFDGNYNVSPRLSADGKLLAFITRNGGRFQVAVQDLASRQTTILTDSARDESPSFAPNGRMILYATESGGRGVLSAVSSDGRIKQRLTVKAADVREPSWGPQPRQ